jgi:DNA polymerase III delta prime subunit
MSAQDKAANLFEYISKVYAIDLPVARIVTGYDDLFWRQADLIPCSHCKIKEFDRGNKSNETNEQPDAVAEDAWLAVYKSSYDDPPPAPPVLKEWVAPSSNPTKKPKPLPAREGGEKFEDKLARLTALNNYLETQWDPWAKQVLPLFKANELYDQLFSLHQRLSVEGDRIEILWGHLFLAWNYSAGIKIHHPLLLTPLDLEFNPDSRKITLRPAQSRTTQFDLECLRDLDYPNKDKFLKHVAKINGGEAPPDVWNHDQMRGIATTVTGLLSTAPVEETNLYEARPIAQPPASPIPAIYNAPVIFVRQRARHFWIDDAQKTAESVLDGAELSPFIRSLVDDQSAAKPLNLEEGAVLEALVEGADDGELFFPLEYNDQQKEILDRLKERFGVLVQGPPGTGKSHTIANIISSLLARGKRVLVTSQTENALKVLRDLIPPEIRSLCVSQLGSDAESKKQLNDSVVEIGKRLALRKSREPEERIRHIGAEMKTVREEQSRLHQQIRDWAELDSCKITIGGAEVTAHQAAKECSQGDRNHSWLPDRLAPETEPPLSDAELKELCALLDLISPQDRQACLQYLPDPARIQSPGNISKVFDDLHFASARAAETEDLRADWQGLLREAQPEELIKALSILEPALADLKRLDSEWRLRLLNLMVSGESQNSFWREFLQACKELYECAFPSFQEIQGFEITVADLPPDFDRDAALEELRVNVEKGKSPSSAFTRLWLSQPAKLLFDAVRIDGKKLTTLQRIDLLWARFSYEDYLKKFELRWEQGIRNVDGPGRDPEALMPLADVESRLKDFRAVVEWIDNYLTQIGTALNSLGCPSHKQTFHKGACLGEHLETLQGQVASIDEHRLTDYLRQLQKQLSGEAKKQEAHPLWAQLAAAIKKRSGEDYKKAYQEATRLAGLRPDVVRLDHLLKRLHSVAPKWASKIEREATKSGVGALPQDWTLAWRWRRLNEWLIRLHNRESVESLQNRLERARKVERELITQLVTERTWERQIANIEDRQYMALTAWANAMRQFGKGTGRYAQRHLAAANRAMVEAVGAVPVWIMPLFRVVQSFEAKPGAFDVIIVDEASQCDLRALPVLYRGKKVLIVGDPEQISPANVGIEKEKIYELNRQFLTNIPYPERFDIDHSLYEITGTIPEIDRILLTEHFRCVPPIIEFNNHLSPSYGGRLEPLRRPSPQEILDPPIQTVYVENGFKNNNDINEPEAERLVESVVNLCHDPRYALVGSNKRKRTMGIISLLGEKQAKHISNLIARHPGLDEREREERRIICGDAYAFQGDERDVMFLSMVIATNAPFAPQVREDARRRFNVATSRARDQVFLFHSVRLRDIDNPECVRHKLLSWYLNPPKSEIEAGLAVLKQRSDSEFEIEVGERIISRGYTVIPQFRPFPRDFQYRIDLVVQGENSRVAIECDGDQWPGAEKWEYDQHREAQLRRAGWKFWRISGSAFYRNKEKALAGLWEFLEDAGVNPIIETVALPPRAPQTLRK